MNVVKRGTVTTRDHGNTARVSRNGSLALWVEEPVGREPRTRQLERLSPEAITLGLHAHDGELHLPASGVHGELAERRDLHAVVRWRWHSTPISRPHDALQLRFVVAKAEVPMAVAMRLEVRHLAANPQRRERAFEYRLCRARQRDDRDRRRRRRTGDFTVSEVGLRRRLATPGLTARRLRASRVARALANSLALARRWRLRLEQLQLARGRNLAATPLRHSPAICVAARNVFFMSIAMVIGPTPPGTGVMSDATCRADAKCTSPTRWYPFATVTLFTRLMPTSMTTAPGLSMSPVIISGRPIAAMRMSARRVCAAKFAVRL